MATLFNLPASVPTVTLHGRYVGPDGRPLRGWVEILAPTPLTFPNADVFVTGPVILPLDAEGKFDVTLPATDVAGSNPTDWAYWITERLQGVADRQPYAIKLPKSLVDPYLDELAPTDPGTPNYVGVEGSRIYQGTATPPAGLGKHGDMYVRTEVTPPFLGITDTRLTTYAKVNSTWTLQTGEIRGHNIYVNNESTGSSLTKPGDLLIRSDTGDFWQRDASGWGTAKGNLKGPKGDKGDKGDTGAQGIQGVKGDTGLRGPDGSKVYASALGSDFDDVGVAGDFGIRTDTGNLYQHDGTTWINKGSIRGPIGATGPKGDTGDTGPMGPAGKDGTGSGTVTAVNGVQPNAQGVVTLSPADVGALPLSGGDLTGSTTIRATGHPFTAFSGDGTTYFRVTDAGHAYSNSLRNTMYNVGIGPTTVDFAGGTYVLGFRDASVVPTANPSGGVAMYSEGGALKVVTPNSRFTVVEPVPLATKGTANGVASLGSDGKVPSVQLPTMPGGGAKNTWTPQALGFEAWSVDPGAVANPSAKYLTPQRLYLTGFNITENTTVNRIVMWARGYGGVSSNRYRAGIYRESGVGTGSLVVQTAGVALTMAGQEAGAMPENKTNHIGAVPMTITTTTLTPGRYWVAWSLVTGGTADFSFFHVQNESPIGTANFWMPGSPWARAWYQSGQTNANLPATLNQAASGALANHDYPIMALARV